MIRKLLIACFLAIVVVCVQAACQPDRFGDDCTCTSNLPKFFAAIECTAPARCADGKWTVSGNVKWAGMRYYVFELNSDTLSITGNFTVTDGTSTIRWRLDDRPGKRSGVLLTENGIQTLAGGLESVLVGFNTSVSPAYANIKFAGWRQYDYKNSLSYFPSLSPDLVNDWVVSRSNNVYLSHASFKQLELRRKAKK